MNEQPTQLSPAELRTPAELRKSIPALVVVFLLIVGFTFSDDVVEFLLDVTGHGNLVETNRQWLVFALDLLLVLATAALKWRISDEPRHCRAFLRMLLTGKWGLGALLVLGGHLVLILTIERRSGLSDLAGFWVRVLASAVFVGAMTMLLISALSEKPVSRGWIAPLVFGTFVVQVASAMWYPWIDGNAGCAGEVSAQFYFDMSQMLAIILLTTAVELNYVRRSAIERDPGRRMAPVFVVLLLCTALALCMSMDVKVDQGPYCGTGAVWHEYITFVVSIQAMAIGLATLVWLLLADAVGQE